MFTRTEGFAQAAVAGEMIVDNLASALGAIARGERITFRREVIDSWRDASWRWLGAALRGNRAEAPLRREGGTCESILEC